MSNHGVDPRAYHNMSRRGQSPSGGKTFQVPNRVHGLIQQGQQKARRPSLQKTAGSGSCSMASPQLAVVRNLPKIYSPLYEMTNLMLPRDIKTLNAWNRHFFCHDEQTQTLTDNGFKYYWEIDLDRDKIATFNPETEDLEFRFAEQLYVFDYDSDIDGPMIHFQTKKIDILVTPHHKMWIDKLNWKDQSTWMNKWNQIDAKNVKRYQHRFRSYVKWQGVEPESKHIEVAGQQIDIETYLAYLGLFLSEGWIGFSGAQKPAPACVGVGQNEYRKNARQAKFDAVTTIIKEMPVPINETLESHHQGNYSLEGAPGIKSFITYGKEYAQHFLEYGRHSQDRFIPKWIKELSPKYLHIILESMILGDGTTSNSDSYARLGTNHMRQVVYTTSSKRLADDVYEIAYKCGYVPTVSLQEKEGNLKDLYLVKINDSVKGHFPVLKSNAKDFKGKERQEVHYKGKVYCVEIPPHNLFITRRNGKITIQGNSTNPIVRNAITLHASYPISKFQIVCEDPKVKDFFEEMFDAMGFRGALLGISLEYWKLGERLDGESLITLEDGSVKKVRNIKVGDKVITHNGRGRSVTSVMRKPTFALDEEGNPVRIYKVKVTGSNEPLIITGNHPIYSELFENIRCPIPSSRKYGHRSYPDKPCHPGHEKEWNLTFRKTKELSVRDQTALAFDTVVIDREDMDEAWCKLFGYYLSEGCIIYNRLKDGTKSISGVDISCAKDSVLNDEIESLMHKVSTHKPCRYTQTNGNEHIRLFDVPLAMSFQRHGGEYAHLKRLSIETMQLPHDKQLCILGGYLNGDGSVDISNGQIQLASSSRSLVNQFVILLARQGVRSTLTSHIAKPNRFVKAGYDIKPNYRLTIRSFDTERFRSVLCEHKANKIKPAKRQTNYGAISDGLYFRSIQEIEDITDQYSETYMYDLEVEDDHSYTANGIIVHNCFPYMELDEDNGVWAYCFAHNPDFIRVKTSPLAKDPVISLVPDDALRKIVQGHNPSDSKLRSQLPAEVISNIMKGSDIPLPNFNAAHLKMLSSDYDVRGTSIITSVYKDLMLYDKIREMQFAQADNMINPLTLVKLGDPQGQWRPNDQDVAAFQAIMEEGQYDPDFKIITHGAVDIQRIGYSGTTLDVTGMWDAINKNLYTGLLAPEAILNGEGPNYCYVNDDNTQIYTNHGYLTLDEIVEYNSESNDLHKNLVQKFKHDDLKIACFNPETEHIEFHSPIEAQVFNYDSDVDGDLVHFHTKKIDLLVTPNHRMWVNRRKTDSGWHDQWEFERADQVNCRTRRFRSVAKWEGTLPPVTIEVAGQTLFYKDYLELVGYYVSEGYACIYEDKEYYKTPQYRMGITQCEYRKEGSVLSTTFPIVKALMDRLPFDVRPSYDKYGQKEFIVYNKDLTCHMGEQFGVGSLNKHLTSNLKNLSPKYLRILLDAIVLGDGHTSISNDHGRNGKNNVEQHQFFSASKRLADDVYEIVFKLGYAPIMRQEIRNEERDSKFKNSNDIWWVEWSESNVGNFPTLDTRSKKYPDGAISRVPYKGKVYCLTVPHNLFVVRRNGKQSIQGNSTASIGLEVLRTRYDRFREQLSEWIEKKVMEPICKLQDFYTRKGGERKLIVPKVVWNKLNLRDMESYISNLIGLMATADEPMGKVSDETVFQILDIDKEEEKKKLRKEAIDSAIRAKEIEALSKMSLEELRTLDPAKPVVDLHKGEEIPTSEETEGEGGGLPGLEDLGGGIMGESPPFGGGEEGGETPGGPGPEEPPGPPGGEGPETPAP